MQKIVQSTHILFVVLLNVMVFNKTWYCRFHSHSINLMQHITAGVLFMRIHVNGLTFSENAPTLTKQTGMGLVFEQAKGKILEKLSSH